jgi:predicted enzyme related to lactoylglutathione lyase
MISRLSHTSVHVLDQARAKAFYTEKLGFAVHTDATMGSFRWITVTPPEQPDLEIALMPIGAGPMMDETTAATLRDLVARGTFGGGVLETDDCRATIAELERRGVTILQQPTERPYGLEALIRDDSGNWFSVSQRPKP